MICHDDILSTTTAGDYEAAALWPGQSLFFLKISVCQFSYLPSFFSPCMEMWWGVSEATERLGNIAVGI